MIKKKFSFYVFFLLTQERGCGLMANIEALKPPQTKAEKEKDMSKYTFLKNNLSQEDKAYWLNRRRGLVPTGDCLRIDGKQGESITKVVFKRSNGVPGYGDVMEWSSNTLCLSCYSRFKLIDKTTGEVIDNDFEP